MKRENVLLVAGVLAFIGFFAFTPQGQEMATKVYGALRRGERVNNPGNIRKGPSWQGLAADQSKDSAFAVFESPFYGLRAMAKLLTNYYKSGLTTISAIISKYAPPNENVTSSYINTVARLSGIPASSTFALTPDNLSKIMKAMIQVEQGRVIYADSEIKKAISAV